MAVLLTCSLSANAQSPASDTMTLSLRTMSKALAGCREAYLRKLLIHGARAAVGRMKRDGLAVGEWLDRLDARAHKNVVVVAMANKLARTAWAVLSSGED
jgi:transposase